MAIVRVHKNDGYTVMSNMHLRDNCLSLKAKGLLSQMLSLPPNWDYTIAGLVSINHEKESAITSALNELKARGYLTVDKKLPNETKSGRFEYEYNVYELPMRERLYSLKQEAKKQGLEIQGVEIQGVENQGQLNKEKSNKDKFIKEYKERNIKERSPIEAVENEEVRNALIEYAKMRKLIKAPMTERAVQMLIKKLNDLSSDPGEQVKIVEQSIMNNWKSVYPLKIDKGDADFKTFDVNDMFEAAKNRTKKMMEDQK